MHDNGVTLQKKVLQNLDIPYSYELAKRMEQYRSHPTLGYRPAGSKAEFETGEMLKTEMEKIGLSEVTKDAVTVDGWEFHKAALSYTNAVGETVSAELGAYQTTFVTDGPKEFSMMYLEKERRRTIREKMSGINWYWWRLTREMSGGSIIRYTRHI